MTAALDDIKKNIERVKEKQSSFQRPYFTVFFE